MWVIEDPAVIYVGECFGNQFFIKILALRRKFYINSSATLFLQALSYTTYLSYQIVLPYLILSFQSP